MITPETGWNDGQIREFSRRFAGLNRDAWHAYVPAVRQALIAEFVFLIVLGQDKASIGVSEMRSLLTRVAVRLAEFHAMPNPDAEAP